jgi:predicted enzyme related to lactoylglutathione lyase
MRAVAFFAAGLFAGLVFQVGMAQSSNSDVVMMNHVGISVPNIDEAVAYYIRKMGYREAFRVNDDKARPRLVYLQISKNTFLELNPVTPQRPAGFSHYGLVVDNAAQAIARFRRSGLTVSDPITSDTKAILANITDPYMGRIELTELPPESLHYKAIQNWK